MRKALLALFFLTSCGSAERGGEGGGRDLSNSTADTSGEIGGETYEEFDQRRDDLNGEAGEIEGYECTEDCGGHSAGYEWAAERGITDESDCGGRSWSFREGCVAYAQEQSGGTQEDDVEDY